MPADTVALDATGLDTDEQALVDRLRARGAEIDVWEPSPATGRSRRATSRA